MFPPSAYFSQASSWPNETEPMEDHPPVDAAETALIPKRMQTAIVDFSMYDCHQTSPSSEENQGRYTAIVNALKKHQLMSSENTIYAAPAPVDTIELCHSTSYIEQLGHECRAAEDTPAKLSSGTVEISRFSFIVATYAAGSVITGIDAVMTEVARNAFCIVRPPGHHASSTTGDGFCLLNNVAIGARYAQQEYNLKRVAIIDWDIHHGNGTEEIFRDDPSVLYVSTHKVGNFFYPGTGSKSTQSNILNFPVKGGKNSANDILETFSGEILPALTRFKPELILISAGFDAHKDDPLGGYMQIEGGFNLDEKSFADLTEIIKNYAEKHVNGRIVSVLEGGYNLEALATSVCAHVRVLKGEDAASVGGGRTSRRRATQF